MAQPKKTSNLYRTFISIACAGMLLCGCGSGSENSDPGTPDPDPGTGDNYTPTFDYSKLTDHPRLLMTESDFEELKKTIEISPDLKKIHDYVIAQSDLHLTEEASPYQMVGKRLTTSLAQKHIMNLAYAYRMTGDSRYLNKAEEDLIAICSFPSWNPSHYLDVAELVLSASFGYDWLYNDLQESTRILIRKAITEFGFQTSYDETDQFIDRVNNWNSICNGGLILGAIALYGDDESMNQECINILERSVAANRFALAEYGPDGNYPEGYGYWCYGNNLQVALIAALEKAFGTDNGLSDIQGFKESAEYMLHMVGVNGKVFNYSDNSEYEQPLLPIWWFARKMNDPSLLYNEIRMLNNGKYVTEKFLPMLLSYATTVDTDKITAPTRTFWHGEGATPVVLIHKDWTLGETDRFLGIKAGKARTGHGHMDAGSFVYDALGCRWAMDLGSQSYTQVEEAGVNLWSMVQNSERWTKVLRIRSDYHNTLTMDLSPFQVDNMCNILETYNSDTEQGAKVDLSGTLGNNYVQSATRTIKLVDSKDLVIHDEVTTAVYGSLRWAMVTPAVPTKISDTCFKLEQNGKTMYMIVESNPEVTLNTWSTDPLYKWDSPNTGTIIVGFDVSVSAGTDVTFNVTLTETPPSGNQF